MTLFSKLYNACEESITKWQEPRKARQTKRLIESYRDELLNVNGTLVDNYVALLMKSKDWTTCDLGAIVEIGIDYDVNLKEIEKAELLYLQLFGEKMDSLPAQTMEDAIACLACDKTCNKEWKCPKGECPVEATK